MKIKLYFILAHITIPLLFPLVMLMWLVMGIWDGLKLSVRYMCEEIELSWPAVVEFYRGGFKQYKEDYEADALHD
jgi:hypothetical protein